MKRLKQDRAIGTADAAMKVFYVAAATKLTSTYAKDAVSTDKDTTRWNTGGYIDCSNLNDDSMSLYDLVQLVAIPVVGSANKIRMRIALSNVYSSGIEEYYRENGRIKEWDFDANESGLRIHLPVLSLKYRYFAIEAKYVGGSDTGTELTVQAYFLWSNTGDGDVTVTRGWAKQNMEVLRAYAVLATGTTVGAWDTPTTFELSGARYADIFGAYVPGATAGLCEIEADRLRTLGTRAYGAPICPVSRGSITSDGASVLCKVRSEIYQPSGVFTNYATSGGSWTTGIVTLTIGAHSIRKGDLVTVSGVTATGYNVSLAEVTDITATAIKYAVTADPGAYSVAGTCRRAVVFWLTFNDAVRYDKIRVRARESASGVTGTPGSLYLLGTTQEE